MTLKNKAQSLAVQHPKSKATQNPTPSEATHAISHHQITKFHSEVAIEFEQRQ